MREESFFPIPLSCVGNKSLHGHSDLQFWWISRYCVVSPSFPSSLFCPSSRCFHCSCLMLACTFPNEISANVCGLWKLFIRFCILCLFPISIIRIIYSDCKLVEISAVSPQGTITVLVGSAALLQGCAITMINDSTKILLLQLAWKVPVNVSSVDADSESSKCVTWNIFKPNPWAAVCTLPVCSLSVPDSCLTPCPPLPTGVIVPCTQLVSSYGGTCHLRYLADQPLNCCSFAQER